MRQLIAKLPEPIRSRVRGLVRGAPSRHEMAPSLSTSAPSEELLTEQDIIAAYRLFHGRAPDPEGLEFFQQHVGTWSVREVLPYFAHSQEFRESETYRVLVGGVGDSEILVVDLGSHRVLVPVGDDAIGGVLVRTGEYEPHVTAAIDEVLTPGSCFIDGGANVGILTMYAASRVGPDGRVVAVEALSYNAGLVAISAALNDYDHVEVIHAALGNTPGGIVMTAASGSNGIVGGSLTQLAATTDPAQLAAAEIAPSLRLDDLGDRLDRVDLVKLDVEGAEAMALQGAQRLIEQHRPAFIIEYSPGLLSQVSMVDGSEMLAHMINHGYTIRTLTSQGGLGLGSDPSAADDALRSSGDDHLDLFLTPK